MLRRRGIAHEVLNAKYHEKEAQIVAQAGHFGAVTIATNMAGRGTDIMLGGNAEYAAKDQLRREGMSEEMILEATGFGETDDQQILDARARFAQLLAKFKEEFARSRLKRSKRRAAYTSSAPSGTNPAGLTISCAAAPAVRATRAPPASTCRWKTI